MKDFTISQELKQGQVDGSFPAWILLQGDAVTSGGKHLPTADGHQLAALIFSSHVVQHSSVIDEGIQFPSRVDEKDFGINLLFDSASHSWCKFGSGSYPVLRLLRASSTPFWLYLTMCECISG